MVAIAEDKSMWTTADYAVLIRGLRDGLDESVGPQKRVTATQLTKMISQDLEEAGFPPDTIQAIEVGRRCRQELKLMRKLESAYIRRHELAARRLVYKQNKAKGESIEDEMAEVEKDEDVLIKAMESILQELQILYAEPDYATGHVFVTFNYEKDKLRFLKAFNADFPPKLKGMFASAKPRVRPDPGDRMPLINRAAEPGRTIQAMSAPEPSEVNWEALELSDAHEKKASVFAWLAVTIQLIVSTLLLIVVRYLRQLQVEGGLVTGANADNVNYSLMLLYSLSTTTTNTLLQLTIPVFTSYEGQDTKTEYEASCFGKLALAYVANGAFVPIFIGFCFSGLPPQREPVDQGWYERSGVVGQMWLLIILTIGAKESVKIVPIIPLVQRYVIPKLGWARSHAKLRQLWIPPPMYISDLYANTMMLSALTMIIGPLYPICYLWGAAGMVACNLCTAFGISRFYARPPAVDVEMMMTLRTILSTILLCQIFMSMFASSTMGFYFGSGFQSYGAKYVAFVIAPLLWLLYAIIPLDKVAPSLFTDPEEDEEALAGDTDGIHHDSVTKLKGYEMVPFICPRITEGIYRAAKEAASSLQQEASVSPRRSSSSPVRAASDDREDDP